MIIVPQRYRQTDTQTDDLPWHHRVYVYSIARKKQNAISLAPVIPCAYSRSISEIQIIALRSSDKHHQN